jgi:hypothetical protein
MDTVTIEDLTATDKMQLEGALEPYGVEFQEVDSADHGYGDMGIFTIVVPLAIALGPPVAKVLKEWIKQRTPITTVKVTVKNGTKTTEVTTKGGAKQPNLDEVLKAAADTGT